MDELLKKAIESILETSQIDDSQKVELIKAIHKSDRSHVVLWAKELPSAIVFLRPLGLRLLYLILF